MRLAAVSVLWALVAIVILVPQAGVAATPKAFFTTSVVSSNAAEVTLSGTAGFNVTFTNSLSVAVTGSVFIELINSAGQTVLIQSSIVTFAPAGMAGSKSGTFLGLSELDFPAGTYTALAFVTTTQLVPISTVTQVQVTIEV